jgi:arylsulfatase A-like enzyme
MRSLGQWLLPWMALGACGTMLLGAADALWVAAATTTAATWAAVPLAAALLLPIGLLLGPLLGAAQTLLFHRGPWPYLRARLGTDEALGPWAAASALVLTFLAAALGPLHALYVRATATLQDADLTDRLSVFVWATELLILVVFALPLTAAAHGLLTALSRKLGRPVHQVVLRAVMHAGLGAGALLLARFCVLDALLLGPALVAPYALLLCVLTTWVAASALRAPVARLAASRVTWLALVLAFTAASLIPSLWRDTSLALGQSVGPARVLETLATITDVDGDGQSGLFGGADCAPFDPLRGPLAFDVPGNRIDEDCNGRDAQSARASKASTYQRKPTPPLPPELVRRYNVVLVVIDAFRADRVGRLSPNLNRLIREGVHFTNAFSQSPSTRLSFPSFLSGRFPHSLRFVRQRGFLQLDTGYDTLATWFRRAGYQTELLTMTWMVRRMPGIFRGYDRVLDHREHEGTPLGPRYTGFSTTARGVEFVERANQDPERPFFLTIYYDGPHSPYDDQSEFGVPPRSKKPADMYDAEIALVDRQLGAFLDHLRMKPAVWNNTVVVMLADHGEEFGEHGGRNHDRTCYVESTHVPLVFRVPGLPSAVAPARVSLVDVAPTLLALTGVAVRAPLDGQNILHTDPATYAHEPDARSHCTFFVDASPTNSLLQSVREGSYAYMKTFRTGREELYDLRTDPKERRNVSKTQPQIRASLATLVSSAPYLPSQKKPRASAKKPSAK